MSSLQAVGAPPAFIVWATRATLYFALQGLGLLIAYALLGFSTDPDTFPPGQRLDPIHAAVHFVWGVAGAYVGFARPHLAVPYLFAFSGFYLMLAALGTFAPEAYHCGMRLSTGENTFHWIVGPLSLAIASLGLMLSEKRS